MARNFPLVIASPAREACRVKLPSILPVLFLALTGPVLAAKLGQDTWREDKKKSDLSTLRFWTYLSEATDGEVVEEKGKRMVRLKEGAKLQSVNVAAYGELIELTGVFDITSPAGSAGFGFIDFSSSLYYYAYWDKAKGKVILQRGDGDNATVLAETEAVPAAPARFRLTADFKTKGRIVLSLQVDGKDSLKAEEALPDKMGATYQIYVGISPDAVVDLMEMTTITSR